MRVDRIKSLLLDLHKGISVEDTKLKLAQIMSEVPYGDVAQAEQELIAEGISENEIMQYCDLHSQALSGNLTVNKKVVPEGHPIDIMKSENKALSDLVLIISHKFESVKNISDKHEINKLFNDVKADFNLLMDIEKHYIKKENLIFPFLEKNGVTAVSKVMWGKDNEVRENIKSAIKVLNSETEVDKDLLEGWFSLVIKPALESVAEMISKEDNILLPMCLDTLTEVDWAEIYAQIPDAGYCIYVPEKQWKPSVVLLDTTESKQNGKIRLSTGSFNVEELESIFKTIPFDLTFVDKDDNVKFFSEGKKRIFARSKAILGRKVQYCHPPSSVHVVDKILSDFKSGKENSAKFWINFKGSMVHIAYFAIRNDAGNYLGTLEISQDISEYRSLEGEKRILD